MSTRNMQAHTPVCCRATIFQANNAHPDILAACPEGKIEACGLTARASKHDLTALQLADTQAGQCPVRSVPCLAGVATASNVRICLAPSRQEELK